MDAENFGREKGRVLHGKEDLSRKGSVDQPILELVGCINSHEHYYTTSSCSGRVVVFSEDNAEEETKKKGCKWLLTSHESISLKQLQSSLSLENIVGSEGYIYVKFEAFVLHVACKEMCHAQQMLQCSISSGFRNSGISVGKKGRIILGVRSTHSLQVPVAYNGCLLVTNEYLDHIVKIVNQKMVENFRRITRFFEELKKAQQALSSKPVSKPVVKYDLKTLQPSLPVKVKSEILDVEPECIAGLFDR